MKSLATILALILVVGLCQVDAMEAEEEGRIVLQVVQKACASCQPDIDECSDNANLCSVNETCMNTPGNFDCNCSEGFRRVGDICEDIDECSDNANLCSVNETCINTPGNFDCNCSEGFTRVGEICEDINECLDDAAFQCEENEDCFNTEGSYDCQCQDEYYREGNTCQPCFSPSLYLEDLGCISYISDQKRSWYDWKTKCQEDGKRLLEGIKYKHLEPLTNHFNPLASSNWVRIGMKNARWITSGEEVTDEDLWLPGQPAGGNNNGCGEIVLNPSSPGLQHFKCDFAEFALCQSLPLD